jgi:TPR repeat protein
MLSCSRLSAALLAWGCGCEAQLQSLQPSALPPACPVDACPLAAPATVEDDANASLCGTNDCAEASPSQCTSLAFDVWSRLKNAADLTCVKTAIADACKRGDPRACGLQGRMLLEDGRHASDSRLGLSLLTRACDGGFALGCSVALRALGEGRDEDPSALSALRARVEVELACSEGQDDACLSAGLSFYSGRDGFPRDRERAVRVYEIGCSLGAALACNNLADALAYGDGTAKDVERAAQLFDRACRLGEPIGCANLGYMVEHGLGEQEDAARARSLYSVACMSGDVYGCLHVEMLAARPSKGMGPSLRDWQKRCESSQDHNQAATACAFVGLLYEDGPDGGARDEVKSLEAMEKACKLGNAYGCEWTKFHVHD